MKPSDFQAASLSDPKRKVFEVIPERLSPVDSKLRMPPPTSPAIPTDGLKALSDWLMAGAKPQVQGCAIHEPAPAGNSATNAAPDMTTLRGGVSPTPIDYHDPALKCYELRAHAPGDKDAPFDLGTQNEVVTNFHFMPPWEGTQYIRSIRGVIDNESILHHILLYQDAAPVTDGAIEDSLAAPVLSHSNAVMIQGWAPGLSPSYFHPDVGLDAPSDVGFTLEIHHYNPQGTRAVDRSGLEVCVTTSVPEHIASFSWLGTNDIAGVTASGVCTPQSKDPIRVISIMPHMHLKGRHMKVELKRGDGGKVELLHDADYDFNFQRAYDVNKDMLPGDSISTRCDFSAPSTFGPSSNDEMCYIFTLYYPKLSLVNSSPVSINGPNSCID
jgi:hypothetical protein